MKLLAILALLLIGTPATACVFVGQKTPVNTPNQSIPKESSGTKGQIQPQTQENNKPTPQPASSSPQPPTATCDETCQQGRENLQIQNRLVWLTGGLVLVGLLQFVALGGQIILFRQQKKIMEEHKVSLEQLAKAAMDGQRAWVLVTVGKLPEITPKPDMLEILWIVPRVANEGKTPAWITRMRLRAQQLPSLGDIPPEPVYEGEGTKHFDGLTTLPSDVSTNPLRVGVNVNDFTAIRQGKVILYVYGFLDYMDVSKRPCSTRFGFLYHVPGGFNPIPEGFVFGGPTAYNEAT